MTQTQRVVREVLRRVLGDDLIADICRTTVRNYTLDEAAAILQCSPRYLEDHISEMPRQKLGKAVVFDDIDLAAIKELHRIRPQGPETAVPATPAAAPSLTSIRPSGRSRKRSA